jgi:hypothetical protein
MLKHLRSTFYRARRFALVGFTLSGALTLVSCNRAGNTGITDGSLGTKIEIVSGNSQLAIPSVIYNEALTVKVSDAVEGKPIPNVKVLFKNLSTSSNGGQVLGDYVLTDESGFASIRAKAPSNFNQSFQVEASVEGTRTVKTVFDLGTESVGECVLFTGRTSVNLDPDATVEVPVTAGVKFGFIIECRDNLGNISTDVTGIRPMTFIFDSKPSWSYFNAPGLGPEGSDQAKWTPRYFENGGAVAKPLSGTTYNFDCNFVEGVCKTPDMYLVTDARTGVNNITRFWVSDATGTILGPAAQPIAVESGPDHELGLSIGAGGPLQGAVSRQYTSYGKSVDDVGSGDRIVHIIDSAGNWKRDLMGDELRYSVTETGRDEDAPVGSVIGAAVRGTTTMSVAEKTIPPFSEAQFTFKAFRAGTGLVTLTQIDPATGLTVRSGTRNLTVLSGQPHHLRIRYSTTGFAQNLADYTAAPLDETDPLYAKYVANVLYDSTTQTLVDPEEIRQKIVAGETYGLYVTARDRNNNLAKSPTNSNMMPGYSGSFAATLSLNLRWYDPVLGDVSSPPFDQPQRHPVPSCNFAQIGEWSMGPAMTCDNGSPTVHSMSFGDAKLVGDAQAYGTKYPTVRIAPLTPPHPLDATDLKNKFIVNVQTAASGAIPVISGASRPVRVLRGPPTWMMLFDQDPAVAHSIVCRSISDLATLVGANTPACIYDAKTSDPQRQFWTRVTDRGGNIIPTTPSLVSATWTGLSHLAGDVYPTDAAGTDIGGPFRPSSVGSVYGAYTAIAAGDSALRLRNAISFSYTPEGTATPVNVPANGIEAAYRIMTQVRGLDQFEVSVDDDRNLPNNIMATKIANIRVRMLDSTGQNTIQQTGQVDLKVQILGATNGRRPDGTSVPWAPCNLTGCTTITPIATGTYAGYSEVTVPGVYFLNGLATIPGLVLPNSSASGNIRLRIALVTDEAVASDKTRPLVSPVVVPGPTNEIRIRTITSGAGNLTNDIQDLTTASPALTPPSGYTYSPRTLSTDANYTYTAATYDRYGNWKQDVTATWDSGSATMTTGSIGSQNSGVPSNGLHLDAEWNSITTSNGVVGTHPSCPGSRSQYQAGGPVAPIDSVSLQVSPFRALAAQPVRVLRASYSPPPSDIDSAYSAGTVFSSTSKFVIQPGNINRVVADWIDNANLTRVNQPMRAGDRFNLRVSLQDSECNRTNDTGVVPLLISKSGMASIRSGYNANYSNYDSGNPLSSGQTTGSTPVQTFFENGQSVGFIPGVPAGDDVADKATAVANPIWFKLNAAANGQRFIVQIDQTPLSGTTGFSPNFITINNTSYDHYSFWPTTSQVAAGGIVQFNVEPRDKFGNTVIDAYDVPSGTFSQASTATSIYFPSQGNAGDGTSCRAAGYYGALTGPCGSEIYTNVNFVAGTWSLASDRQTASGEIDSSLNNGVGVFTATFRQSANNPGRDLRVSTPTAAVGGSLYTANHLVTPVRVLPLPVSDPAHDVSNPIKLAWNVRPGVLNGGTGNYEHTVSRTATMNAPSGFSAKIFDRYDNWVWTDNSTTGLVSMVVPGVNTDNVDPAIFQDSRFNTASPLTSDVTSNGTITWTYARYPRAHASLVTLSAAVNAGGGATITSNVKFNAGSAAQVLALMTGSSNATPWSQTAQGSEQGFQGGVNCLVANPPACTVGALTGTPTTKRAGQPFRVTLLLVDDAFNIVPAAGGSFRLQLVTNGSGIPDDPNATITVDRTSAGGSATAAYTPNTDVSLNALDGGIVSFMVTPKKAGSFSGAWPVPTVGSTYQIAPSAGFLPGVSSTAYTVQPAVPSAIPGSPLKLTALLQGQTLTSGQASTSSTPTQAVSGTAASQSVGDDFEVRVYATDAYFNPVGAEAAVTGSTVTLQSNDLSPTSPNATFDSNGIAVFNTTNANAFNFKRAMPYNSAVVASAIPSAKFTLSGTSISNTVVPNSASNRFDSSNFTTTPDSATQTVIRLAEQFLVPGSSSAGAAITNGSAPGCAGSSFCRTAGVASRVDVLAVDANFNIDPSYRSGGTANLSTPADTPSGVGEPTVYRTPTTTFASGIAAFLNAAPILGNGGTGASPDTSGRVQFFSGTEALATNNSSTNITVRPNTPTNVLVRLNSAGILSQVFTPGQISSTTALTGTPSTVDPAQALSYAGNPFLFDVILADAYFNQVPDSTTTTQISSPGDAIASFDFNGDDVFGDSLTQTFTNGRISNVKVKNFLAGNSRVIRANSGSGSLDYQSPPYIINNGPAFKIVTPGQPQLNSPGTVIAGTAFSYPYAIFDEWNNALTYGPDTTSDVTISLSTAPTGGALCNATDAAFNADPSNIAYYLCTPYSPANVTSAAATGLPLTSGTFSAVSGLNIRRAAASAYRLRLTKASTAGSATQNRPAGTGSIVATSDLFSASNSPATTLTLSNINLNTNVAAGTPDTVTVTAYDKYSNVAQDYAGPVDFSTTQDTLDEYAEISGRVLPPSSPLSGGTVTIANVLLLTAATEVASFPALSVSVTGARPGGGPNTGTCPAGVPGSGTLCATVSGIQRKAGTLHHLNVRTDSTATNYTNTPRLAGVANPADTNSPRNKVLTRTAGQPLDVLVVQAEDIYNNRVVGFTGTLNFRAWNVGTNSLDTNSGNFVTTLPSSSLSFTLGEQGRKVLLGSATGGSVGTSVIFRKTDTNSTSSVRQVQAQAVGFLGNAYTSSPNITVNAAPAWRIATESQVGKPQGSEIVVNNLASNSHPAVRVYDYYDNPVATATVRYSVLGGGLADNATVNGLGSQVDLPVSAVAGAGLGVATLNAPGWKTGRYIGSLSSGAGGVNPFPAPVASSFNPYKIRAALLSPATPVDQDGSIESALAARTATRVSSIDWDTLYARSDIGNQIAFVDFPSSSPQITAGVSFSTGFSGANSVRVGLFDQYGNPIDSRTKASGDESTQISLRAYPSALDCSASTNEIAIVTNPNPVFNGAPSPHASNFVNGVKSVSTSAVTVADGSMTTYRAVFDDTAIVTAADTLWIQARVTSGPAGLSGKFACAPNAIAVKPAAPSKLTFNSVSLSATTGQNLGASSPVVAIRDVYGNTVKTPNYAVTQDIQLRARTSSCSGTIRTKAGDGTTDALTKGDGSALAALTAPTSGAVVTYSANGGLRMNYTDPANYSNVYLEAYSTDAGVTVACAGPITVSPTPYRLAFTQMPDTLWHADAALQTQPVVRVFDQYGNLANLTGTIQLQATTDTSCLVPAGNTPNSSAPLVSGANKDQISIAAANVATFTGTQLRLKSSSLHLKASVSGDPSIFPDCTGSPYVAAGYPVSATTTVITAGAPVMANSTVSATDNVVVSTGSLQSTATLTLRDQFLNLVQTGIAPLSISAPSFSISGTGNTTSCAASTHTNASGVLTCTLSSTKAETKTLTVTVPSIASSTAGNARFLAADADRVRIMNGVAGSGVSALTTTVNAGASFSPVVVAEIQDEFGNPVEKTGSSPSPSPDNARNLVLEAFSDPGCTTNTNLLYTAGVAGVSQSAVSTTSRAIFAATVNHRATGTIYLRVSKSAAAWTSPRSILSDCFSATPMTINPLGPHHTTTTFAVTSTDLVGGTPNYYLTASPGTSGASPSASIQISLKDVYGNPTDGGGLTPTVTVSGSGTQTMVCGVANSSTGVAVCTFTARTVGTRDFTITGFTPSTPGTWISNVSATNKIRVVPDAAAKLAYTPEPSGVGRAGVAFGTQPTVEIRDTYDNTILSAATASSYGLTPDAKLGSSVTLTAWTGSCGSSQGAGYLNNAGDSQTASASASPAVSFSGLTYTKTSQAVYFQAAATALTPACTSSPLTITQPSTTAGDIVLSSVPATVVAGTAFSTPAMSVTLRDVYQNVKTDYASTVTLSTNDTAATAAGWYPSPTLTYILSDNGVKTFPVRLKTTTGPWTVSAAASGYTSATTSGINVSPATIGSFVIGAVSPSSPKAGDLLTVSVTAKDTQGNTKTDYSGTVNLASIAGGSESLGTCAGFTNGVASCSFTLTTSGTRNVSFTDSSVGTATGNTGTFALVPNVPHFSKSLVSVGATCGATSSSVSIVSGNATTICLQPRDEYDNVITSNSGIYSVAVSFAHSGGGSTLLQNDGSTALPVVASWDAGNQRWSAPVRGFSSGSPTSIVSTVSASTVSTAAPTVTVTPGAISATTSTMAMTESSGTANDGTIASGSNVTFTIQARDAANNALTSGGSTISVFYTGAGSDFTQVSAVTATDNSNGTYTAVLTGKTVGAAVTVSAKLGTWAAGTAFAAGQDKSVTVIPGGMSATTSTMAMTESSGTANDGTIASGSNVTFTIQARDAANNALTSGGSTVSVFFTGAGSDFTQVAAVTATDNSDGTYTAVLTGKTSGAAVTVSAKLGTWAAGTAFAAGQNKSVTVIPGAMSATTSTVAMTESSGTANDGTIASGANVTFTIQARDAANNAITSGGSTVSVFYTGAGSDFTQVAAVTATDNSNGTYTAVLTGKTSGAAVTVSAKLGTWAAGTAFAASQDKSVTVIPGAMSATTSTVAMTESSGTANDGTIASGSNVTFTIQARDAANNAITSGGSTVSVFYTGAGSDFTQVAAVTATDNSNGTYTAVLTGKTAGAAVTVSAKLGTWAAGTAFGAGQDKAVTVIPGGMSATTSTVAMTESSGTVDDGTIASGSNVSFTIQARDAANNALTSGGSTVSVFFTGAGSDFTQVAAVTATDNSDGTYTAVLTGKTSGAAVTVSAKLGTWAAGTAFAAGQNKSVTVIPGAMSATTSTVAMTESSGTANDGTIASGSNVTFTIQARDAANNAVTSGGSTVSVYFTGAGSDFTQVAAVTATDNSNGTYTAVLTGKTSGAAVTVSAKLGTWAGGTAFGAGQDKSVTVIPGAMSATTSTMAMTESSGTANDGIIASGSNVTFTIQARDAANNALTSGGSTVSVFYTGAGSDFTQVAAVTATDNSDGTYTAVLTGKTSGAAVTVSAKLGTWAAGTAFGAGQNKSVTVIPGGMSATTSTVAMTESSGTANDGTIASGSNVTFTIQARDAANNTVTSGGSTVSVYFTGAGSDFTQVAAVTATDNSDGTYTAVLTGKTSGAAVTVSAKLGTWAGGTAFAAGQNKSVTVIPGAMSATTSTVAMTESSGTANDGTIASGSNVTFTIQARDAANNALTSGGSTVSVFYTGAGSDFTQVAAVTATDNSNGTYTAVLTGKTAGATVTVSAKLGTWAAGTAFAVGQDKSVTVIPGVMSATTSTMALTESSGTANDGTIASGSNVTFTIQARDAANNAVTSGGSTVSVFYTGAGSDFTQVAAVTATDNSDGTYTAVLTGKTSGAAVTVSAKLGTWAAGTAFGAGQDKSVTVIPGGMSATTSTMAMTESSGTANDGIIASGSNVTFTIQARDAANNTVTSGGSTVSVYFTGAGSDFTQVAAVTATDNSDGTYTAVLTGKTSGAAVTVSAKLGTWAGGTAFGAGQNKTVTVIPGVMSATTSTMAMTESSGTANDGIISSGSNVTFTVQARDAANNAITSGGSTVSVFYTGAGSDFTQVAAVTATDNSDGTYTAVLTGKSSGAAVTVSAKLGTWAAGTAFAAGQDKLVTVIPGAMSATTSTVALTESSGTADDGTIASGSNVTFTIQARDAANNAITSGGSTVSVFYTGAGSDFTQVAAVTATDNSNGTYTAVLTGKTAGAAVTVSAKLGTWAAGTAFGAGQNKSVTVSAGSLDHFVITQLDANPRVAGAVTQIEVSAADAAGNLVSSWTGALSFTCSETGFSTSCPSGSISSGGTATFNATLNVATTQSISVLAATKTGSLTGIVVNPAAADSVTVASNNNQTATVSTAVPLAVTFQVKDIHGNNVKGGTAPNATLSLTLSTSDGSVTPTSISVNSSGIATMGASTWTLPSSAGSKTLTAQVPSAGSVNVSATAEAGTATKLVQYASTLTSESFKNASIGSVSVKLQDTSSNDKAQALVPVTLEGYATADCTGAHTTVVSAVNTDASGHVTLSGAQFSSSGAKSVRAESAGLTESACHALTVYNDPTVSVSSASLVGGATSTVTVGGGKTPGSASVTSGGSLGTLVTTTFTAGTDAADCGTAVISASETINGVLRTGTENIDVTQTPVLSHDLGSDHDYGIIDSDSDKIVTISNASCGASGVLAASISGAGAAKFQVINTLTCDSGIGLGSCTVTVRYKGVATEVGPYNATVNFTAGGSSNAGLPSRNLTGESNP